MLALAGRFVATEQADPSMGPNARLDIVEYASQGGGSAAYDVSVVTPFRSDPAFVARCAQNPGHAAASRHAHKLETQYQFRVPGARLIPLVAETCGRWHSSVPSLVRRCAREYVQRTPSLPPSAVSAVAARWGARLSAHLLRGSALVLDAVVPPHFDQPVAPQASLEGPLPAACPEGDSAYELLVGA